MPASTGAPVEVGVTWPLTPAMRATLTAVSDHIHLVELNPTLAREHPERWVRRGRPVPDPSAAAPDGAASLAELLSPLEVLAHSPYFPPGRIGDARSVRWMFTLNSQQIPEWAVAAMLWFAHGTQQWGEHQRRHQWQRPTGSGPLFGRTVGIVGMGLAGKKLARVCQALEMRVLGTRKHLGEPVPGVELVPLEELLAASDFVVLAVPLTPETQGLIDAAALRRMRPEAVLLNPARGAVVDESAVLAALAEGTIAGAALDTFTQEPLPPDSPFWDLPNVLVTPHLAGAPRNSAELATDIFAENLRRYLAGEPLQYDIDPSRGW